jgi:hypothetical protein
MMRTLGPLPLLAVVIATFLAALWAGLIRLGWGWPTFQPGLPLLHGPLMLAFLGTLITLERAVALAKGWAYGAPVLLGLGALGLVIGLPGPPAPLLITLGSALLVLIMVQIVRIQPAIFTLTIGLGVLTWLIGNLLWLAGRPIPQVTPWWIGFLLLTIAGERLELSRLLRLSRPVYGAFAASVLLFVAGAGLSLVDFAIGMRITGVGMVALALWLLRYDIAWRRLKAGGQARFIALSLLSGYGWLAVAGLLTLRYGGVLAGLAYDAMLHSLFLGFVFTMLFAHAPIIFPVVLHLPVVYTPRFYTHLILLHLTLSLRIAGDLLAWWPGRLWGGLLNGVVLLLFLVNTVTSIQRTRP